MYTPKSWPLPQEQIPFSYPNLVYWREPWEVQRPAWGLKAGRWQRWDSRPCQPCSAQVLETDSGNCQRPQPAPLCCIHTLWGSYRVKDLRETDATSASKRGSWRWWNQHKGIHGDVVSVQAAELRYWDHLALTLQRPRETCWSRGKWMAGPKLQPRFPDFL